MRKIYSSEVITQSDLDLLTDIEINRLSGTGFEENFQDINNRRVLELEL